MTIILRTGKAEMYVIYNLVVSKYNFKKIISNRFDTFLCMLFSEVSKHAAFNYLLYPVPKSLPLLLKALVISKTFIGTR